jgi:hypothetical protein
VKEARAQRPLETWTAAEVDLAIEYAPQLLDEINAYALDGLKQLSRSGIAVGGVLFGSRGEKSVRILCWRPIACEHAISAAFVLSPNDRSGLAQLLKSASADPELGGLHALGWFVAHTREGVWLNDSDLEIYSHFFPWSWQIALVVRPFRDRATQAGFFVRDAEGRVKSDASPNEFQIAGVAARLERPLPLPVVARYEPMAPELPRKDDQPEPIPTSPATVPRRSLAQARIFSDRRLWIWAVPVMLALLVWAMLLEKPVPAPVSPPALGFHAVDSAGLLRLAWDKSAQPVREATKAVLVIHDGGAPPVRLDLDPATLAQGAYVYSRKTADVEVFLTVSPKTGPPIEESARFVGSPILLPVTDNPVELRKQRDALAKDNERLRDDLRRETNRNRDLEEAIRALENRVQVEQSQKK